MKKIQDVKLDRQTVFLRVDFNVPIYKGKITDNNRIIAAVPTIRWLAENRCKVVIGTHLGRPKGRKSADTTLAPVAKELQRILNLRVEMANGLIGAPVKKQIDSLPPSGIILLENLRWNAGEEKDDSKFAKELAELTRDGNNDLGVYVNDAFAVSHRANASVHAITKYLPSYAGLLLQKEVENLSKILVPNQPFIVVIGGIKISDKAGVISKLEHKASHILLGGGVANTFLKAKGMDIKKSVYDEGMVSKCKEMLDKFGEKIVLPTDFEVDKNGTILDLGAKTRADFVGMIKNARTIFWNGNLGKTEDTKYTESTRQVAKAMSDVNATTVIAGGDTVGFIKQEKLDRNISYISTGGGAALEFLSGEKLPGIQVLQ